MAASMERWTAAHGNDQTRSNGRGSANGSRSTRLAAWQRDNCERLQRRLAEQDKQWFAMMRKTARTASGSDAQRGSATNKQQGRSLGGSSRARSRDEQDFILANKQCSALQFKTRSGFYVKATCCKAECFECGQLLLRCFMELDDYWAATSWVAVS
ncbi:hypothetical protein Dimus_024413 [Dionaea muscipula]